MATVAGSLRNKVLVLDDLTTGDLTVTGALTLSGTATQINSTNTTISDHLIELGSGLTGANANDLGLILERGSTGNNVFIGWDESTDKVVVATTTATGSSTGNLTLAAANFQAADISMSTGASSGKFAVMSSAVHGSFDFYNNGTSYFNGTTEVNAEFKISSSSSYITHFNYLDGGNNIISQANGGSTTIRNSNGNLFGISSNGSITSTGLDHTFYSGGADVDFSIGRDATQALHINVDDGNIKLTADQDADGNGTHDFILDRTFDGTGANNFKIRKGGVDQLIINKDSNATFAGVITSQGTSGSSFYGMTLSRSGTGIVTPDLWGSNNTLVLGTSSSEEVIGMAGSNATFYGDIYAKDSNSATDPTIAFVGHTDSGLSMSVSGGNDQLSVITDGVRRGYFNNAGITSESNVYTSGGGSFRNYGSAWVASTGVSGNGFSFLNSVDGPNNTSITPMTINTTGTVTALADFRAPIFYDSSNTDFYVDPVGNSKLYGTLYLGHTNSQSGNLAIYDTGNNYLDFKATGANAFSMDMAGTGSVGQFTFNDFNVDVTGYLQHFGVLYSRDDLNVLNTAGNGWNTWANRNNGTYDLTIGSVTSVGNSTFTGGSADGSGNAFVINRGGNSNQQAFRVNNTGEVVVSNNYLYCTSTGVAFYAQGSAVFRGGITNDGGNDLSLTSPTSYIDINNKILKDVGGVDLDNGDHIAFYGNDSKDHAMFAYLDDDIRINSYGSIFLSLDSNGNNDSAADFKIVKHAGGTSSWANNQELLCLRGDNSNGDLTIGGSFGLSDQPYYAKLAIPGTEAAWAGSGTTTGAVVIDLPGTLSNYDMLYLEIDVFEYNGKGGSKIIIGTHNWNSGANSGTSNQMWHNTDVRIVGRFDKEIYFGWRNDGTNNRRVIVLGNHTSSWSYGTVHVGKVSGATDFYTAAIDYTGNWNVTQSTSSSFYTKSPTTDWNGSDRRTMRVHRAMHANRVYADSDMRAPHYYDLDNTAYYTNPASTSHMNAIALADGIYHKDDTNTYHQFNANDSWRVVTGGEERLKANNGEVIVNDNSADMDFRVESNNEANMLFVDGSTDRVGIGTNTPGASLDIYGSAAALRVYKTANDAKAIIKSSTAAGWVEFQSPNYYSGLLHNINGTEQWALGTLQGQSQYTLRRGRSGNTVISATTDENVGIGIREPSANDVSGRGTPKLHVKKSTTQGVNNLVARFESGNDNNNTGAAILINHSNDRGLLIEGGRGVLDRGIAHFGIVNSGGTNTRLMTLHQDGTAYKVGIGTTSPSAKLHISGNSDVSDEDCMLIIDDVDGSAGSRIPAIMFRSNTGGTVTNQGRIRGTDTEGMVLSGNSSLADDLVVASTSAGRVSVNTTTQTADGLTIGTGNSNCELDLTHTSGKRYRFANFSNGKLHIQNKTDGLDNILVINGSQIGINTTAPGARLDVEAGGLGGTTGNTSTAAIFRAGRQNLIFQDTRTATGTDWNNATFKMIAQIDSTNHQSIDFVNDSNFNEHIDIRTGNQVFNTRFTHNGRVGIGTTDPLEKLDVVGIVNVQRGQVWNATTQGATRGSVHIDPASLTDHAGGSITFGASDHSNGTAADAGIYIRSDGSYGTRMYLSTTDSYASGSKTALSIDSTGIVKSTRSRIESASDMRASIFYDSGNTGYYVDPAASSKLVYLGLATDPDTSGSYRLQMGGNIDMNNNHIHYADQVHFNPGIRFEPDSNSVLTLWGGNTSNVQLNLGTGAQERNGALYADSSNNVGLLDSDNHWAIRHTANSATYFSINNSAKVRINNSGIRFDHAVTDNGHKNALMNMANLAGANLLTASTDIARRYGSGSNREFRTFVDGSQVPCHYSQGVNNNATCYQWISTEFVDVDPEKSYQYTIWVQAEGDHNIYMGWHEKNAAGTTITSNPYFHTSTMDTNAGWVKITAILHGHRTPAGQSDTEGTDRYTSGGSQFLDGGAGAQSNDGVMHSTTRTIMMRFGTCYGTSNTAKTYFYAPTIKEINYENHQHGFTVPNIQNNIISQGSLHFGKTSWSNYSGIEYRDCTGSQEFRMSSTSGDLNLRVDGTIQAHGTGGIEASIFKDINNASYYLHLDGTSNVNTLGVAGNLTVGGHVSIGSSKNYKINNVAAIGKSSTTLRIGDIDENDDWGTVDILAMAGTGRVYIADGEIFFNGTSNGSAGFKMIGTTGAFHANNDIIAYSSTLTASDGRLKENVRPIESSLNKILTLDGVKFDWKDEDKPNDQLGFIAQDVEKVLPEVVNEIENGLGDYDGHKVVNYQAVVPVLVEAIKELKAEIDELKEQLKKK